jgi:hypothetical protein
MTQIMEIQHLLTPRDKNIVEANNPIIEALEFKIKRELQSNFMLKYQ